MAEDNRIDDNLNAADANVQPSASADEGLDPAAASWREKAVEGAYPTGQFSRRNAAKSPRSGVSRTLLHRNADNTTRSGGGYFQHDSQGAHSAAHGTSSGRLKHVIIIVLVCAVVAAGIFLGFEIARMVSGDGSAVVAGEDVTVTIPSGAGTTQIATLLKNSGVISDTDSFMSLVNDKDAADSIWPGQYDMKTGMSDEDALNLLLSHQTKQGTSLTVPEGYTCAQIADLVEQTCGDTTGITAADFLALCNSASTYAADYPFLADDTSGSLEGFLFPKTYTISNDATADSIIRMMLDQFQTEFAALDTTYPTSKGLNTYQIVTMASLVEREGLKDEDRPTIASVLYNRLDAGMKLQLDVTVRYAMQHDGLEVTGDTFDTTYDSPYNTYVCDGLPAGPIANPGIASLTAVCSPQTTNYLYFILTSDYSNFYETDAEFTEGKAAYDASKAASTSAAASGATS